MPRLPSLTSPRCAGHPSGESGKEPGLSPPPSPGPVTANHLTSSFPKLHETSGSAGSAPQQPAPGSYPHRDPGPGAATSQGPATSQPGPALPSSAAQQVNGGGAAAVVAQLSQHNNLQEHLQQQQKVITRRLFCVQNSVIALYNTYQICWIVLVLGWVVPPHHTVRPTFTSHFGYAFVMQ